MGEWSIELGERPINSGRLVDFLLGKNISHSFIRVKNGEGDTILELHGLYSNSIGAVYNTAASYLTGRSRHACRLHVLAITSDRLIRIFKAHCAVTDTTEIRGSEDTILRDAECMIRAAAIINLDHPDYYFGPKTSQTCHSVSAELLRRIRIDIQKQSSIYKRPGIETDLERIEPELTSITPNWTAPLADIKRAIFDGIASFSPDAKMALTWLISGCARPKEKRQDLRLSTQPA